MCELDKYVPVVPTTSKKCSLIDFLGSREFMQAAPKANDGLRLEFQSTMLSNPPPPHPPRPTPYIYYEFGAKGSQNTD